MIDEKQKKEGWGASVIPRLSKDIINELPEIKGFSERNLKRMISFYREYKNLQIVPQSVAQLPWGHNVLLMQKIKNINIRFWYMQKTLENGWSRNVTRTLPKKLKSVLPTIKEIEKELSNIGNKK